MTPPRQVLRRLRARARARAVRGPAGGRSGESGMLLLEALIWVALLSMLAVMIGEGASLTTRAWSSAERQTNQVDDLETVRTFLRRMIVHAQPALASPDPADLRIAFDGGPDRLTLVAPRSGQVEAGQWLLQSLSVAPKDGGSALFLTWQGSAGGIGPGAPKAPVLDGVTQVRFRYFGPPEGGGAAAWQDDWRNRTQLPYMVRMTMERSGQSAAAWPDFVVATKVRANAACRFRPGAGGCQRGQ
ncbi:hypothetical protein ACFOGJ_13340 [Marinibaculum pumilum]|uniref:Prepilin-type N-terminal cleavage/methylation domain-containing protein n=1 Tax=Marinibaculum pumilum TaxID=1766165 RepID=A0ABV7L0N8_9PROT